MQQNNRKQQMKRVVFQGMFGKKTKKNILNTAKAYAMHERQTCQLHSELFENTLLCVHSFTSHTVKQLLHILIGMFLLIEKDLNCSEMLQHYYSNTYNEQPKYKTH